MIRTLTLRVLPFGLAFCLAIPPVALAQGITLGESEPAIDQGVAAVIVALKTHGLVGVQMMVQGCYAQVPAGGLSIPLLKCLGEDTVGLRLANAGYTAEHFPIPRYFAMPAFHDRAQNELVQHGVTAPVAVTNTMNNVMTQATDAMVGDLKPK